MSVSVNVRTFGKAFNKRSVTDYLVKPAIKQTLEDAVTTLKSFTPVDTGKAREGWRINPSNRSIDNEVFYVRYLDEGTVKMKSFRITAQSLPKIKELFKLNIENAIDNLNK